MSFEFTLVCPRNSTLNSWTLFQTLKTLDLQDAYREHKLSHNSFTLGPFQDKDTAQATREILSEQGFRCSPVYPI